MTPAVNPYEGVPDTALMLQVREGDASAFAALYDRYYRKLLDFFYAKSRCAQTAEDMCQETFLRVWKLRRQYIAAGSFPAYIFAFARNIWLERCRITRKEQRLDLAQDIEDWDDEIAGRLSRPDEVASRLELEERILKALDALPEEQKTVFVMRHIQGLSVEDIASAMQCPVNTVRSRKLLAIKKLREALKGLLVL